MKWYQGGIAEAIVFSKSKGAIFVVYIEGNDEQSNKISSLIENGQLGLKLEQDSFVAIKLEAGSTPHHQFSEIYKQPSVPSIYFIGKSGAPLDIITGNDDLDNITGKIDDILSKSGISVNSTASSLTTSLLDSERSSGEQSNETVCENGVCLIKTTDLNSETEKPSSSSEKIKMSGSEDSNSKSEENKKEEPTPEDKVQRAKELLEMKRIQKEKEEKENERLKELERRNQGQGVQQLKKWQEDQEMKQLKEERDREKRENQLARERVLAQIAQDRAERLSRSQVNSPQTSESPKPVAPTISSVNSNTTRLQFRLPDGSSTTSVFANSDSLQTVISYIKANLKLPFSDFTLSTTFPRREFTNNDYSQTLMDLQLIPNAVILVLPISHGMVSTNPGGTFSSMLWSLLAPILSIFGYLKVFLFGGNPNAGGNKRPSGEPTEHRSDRQKKRMRDSTVVRRQGNIHRLGDNDSEDDDKTWNGNSTQQM
ncbi:hypothetical protein JTB14_037170 [Gonioctena quinquepunctata]|nr:hypothetical protein JTB14_037170 [Gonioctena quinquepunctata]